MTFVAGQIVTADDLNAITTDINNTDRAWYATAGTSDQSGISTIADLTGCSVTWTASSDRLYKVSAVICIQKITSGNAVTLYITNGSNTAQQAASSTMVTNELRMIPIEKILTGLSGSTTMKLRAETAGGTITIVNSFNRNGQIIVEDIGPA